MSLIESLLFIGTQPGINFVIGILLSFVVEWFPDFTDTTPKRKRLITMILSFVVPVISLVGLWALGEIAIDANSVWDALFVGGTAFFGSQTSHMRKLATE